MITIDHEPESNAGDERRTHPRVDLQRPVKVFDPQSGKYHTGSTCDVSAGGVLIELAHAIPARPGNDVLLGIAQKRRQPLLRRNEMVPARIVRTVHADGGRMLLAAEFPPETALPLERPRLAA